MLVVLVQKAFNKATNLGETDVVQVAEGEDPPPEAKVMGNHPKSTYQMGKQMIQMEWATNIS